jgi:hypothetical protein
MEALEPGKGLVTGSVLVATHVTIFVGYLLSQYWFTSHNAFGDRRNIWLQRRL